MGSCLTLVTAGMPGGPNRKENAMKNLVLLLAASLSAWSAMAQEPIVLNRERAASASLCPDQASAEAVLTTHATKGMQAASLLYGEKCVTATVLLVPQAVVVRRTVEGQSLKVVRVLVRMADESQTTWFMLTATPIAGETGA